MMKYLRLLFICAPLAMLTACGTNKYAYDAHQQLHESQPITKPKNYHHVPQNEEYYPIPNTVQKKLSPPDLKPPDNEP